MKLTLKWLLLVAIACLCGTTNLAARSDAADNGYYTTNDIEFYLAPEDLVFIRPGLEIEILEVMIPADMQPEVTYTISDPAGLPLDHYGVTTPGEVDMRFTLANIPVGEEQKIRLAYERIGRDGPLTMLAPGKYHYKFNAVIESDQDSTHTLVLGGRRDLRDPPWYLERYADNALQTWVPSGVNDAVPRDIVTAPTCNRCHQELQEHGRWQSPQACTQCHNPTRNTRFDVLIHAVHDAGEAGGHDFSEIEYPTDVKDCQVCHTGGTPTEAFPLVATPNSPEVCDMTGRGITMLEWGDLDPFEIRLHAPDGKLFANQSGKAGSQETDKWVKDGTVFYLIDKASGDTIQMLTVNTTALGCVSNAPGISRGEPGAQHTNWMDHPSRAVCGSCHSDVNFETGENHSEFNIVVPDDSTCGNCHEPDSGIEYDRSVAGAHQMLYNSAQLPGVIVEFKEVTNSNPGDAPIITYSVKSKNGKLIPAEMNRLRFVITGPNEDYNFYAQEDVRSGSVQVGDNWVYTFNTPLPMDAKGSFTVGLEGRNVVPVDFGDEVSDERDVAEPPNFAFAVTDATRVPRRMVVDDEKCESCHVNLALHGGGRDLENGYVVVRSRGTFDFSDKVFPGDLRNCDACHVNDSQQLPLPAGLLPTITEQAWWDPTLPQAAACLSCHDGDDAAAHAYSNTAFFGESCATCHGEGKFASVDRVHAK